MAEDLNVLFIIVDQLRADCVSGALAAHARLPNIQAFGREAVRFDQHFSVANPCGPSRASILTGRYAMNHRSVRNGTPLADGIPNLALEARRAGYEPLLFGYTDTPLDPRGRPLSDPALASEEQILPGFHEALEMRLQQSYPWRGWLAAKGYDLPPYAEFYQPRSPDQSRPARPTDPPFYRAEHSDTAFLTNRFLQDMAARVGHKWFALLTYIRPHPPLVAPPPYNTMYEAAQLPLPRRLESIEAEAAVHPYMAGMLDYMPMAAMVQGCPVDAEDDKDIQRLRAVYLGLASEVDHHLGRVFTWLRQSGQFDNTLIVLGADHGEMLGDHHMWGKHAPHDPAWHVPLMIRDPRQRGVHGKRVRAFTQSCDVTPTILDLIGGAVPAGMDGVSLRPFLEGRAPDRWRDFVHMELEYGEPDHLSAQAAATGTSLNQSNYAILREEKFKLVHFNGDLPALLFDLERDPGELHDLAGKPEYAPELLRLTRKLLSHRMAHADRTLTGFRNGPGGAREYPQV